MSFELLKTSTFLLFCYFITLFDIVCLCLSVVTWNSQPWLLPWFSTEKKKRITENYWGKYV